MGTKFLSAPRISIITSLAHLPGPECSKYGLFAWPKGSFQPLVPYLGHSGSGMLAKLVSLAVLSAVTTLFQPVPQFALVLRYLAYLNYIWAYFGLFLPLLDPVGQLFNQAHLEKKAQHGSAECLLLCSNCVPPLPTKHGPSGPICWAKRLFWVYLAIWDIFSQFYHIWAYFCLWANHFTMIT